MHESSVRLQSSLSVMSSPRDARICIPGGGQQPDPVGSTSF
jgi:hypothetical protein